MLKKLSIQRSLLGIVGLLMIAGMVILTIVLAVMQRNNRQARNQQLNAFFGELSASTQASISHMNTAVTFLVQNILIFVVQKLDE